MNCPKCHKDVGWWYGMSGCPDSDRFWSCPHCGFTFYYTNNGKLYKYDSTIKKWIKADLKEIVVFT